MEYNLIFYFTTQLFFIFGVVILCGLLIDYISKRIYSNLGQYAIPICYITGAIAVPIHEASHALFALIFRHKIIEFQPFKIDNITLGFVKHSYKRNSLYQCIGNYFIGIAPIVVISILIYVLSLALIPSFYEYSNAFFNQLKNPTSITELINSIKHIFVNFFNIESRLKFYLFLFLNISLSLHMTLSLADIKNSKSGVIFVLFLLAVTNFIIYLSDGTSGISIFTRKIIETVSPIFCMMCFSILFLVLMFIVSLLVKVTSIKG